MKKLVHHRALNSTKNVQKFLKNFNRYDQKFIHVAEGDLCWDFYDGKYIFYFYHPSLLQSLPHGKDLINKIQNGSLNSLSYILSLFDRKEHHLVLELKNGYGDELLAISELCDLLDKEFCLNKILIDSFALRHLKLIKKYSHSLQTSLHNKFMLKSLVLETSFLFPFINLHNLDNLKDVDSFTISYATSLAKIFNIDIDKFFNFFLKSGKKVNLGAIKRVADFHKALSSEVDYIYLRSDAVKQLIYSNE